MQLGAPLPWQCSIEHTHAAAAERQQPHCAVQGDSLLLLLLLVVAGSWLCGCFCWRWECQLQRGVTHQLYGRAVQTGLCSVRIVTLPQGPDLAPEKAVSWGPDPLKYSSINTVADTSS